MDLMQSVGRLVAHADEPGTVSEALKDVFLQLKIEAHNRTPVGLKVIEVLKRISENAEDPFYEGMPMLERVQAQQMAHSAVKIVELGG